MKIYELIAPCHFGLEAVLKREITDLGYEISKVEDGKVTFLGDAQAICYANIFLRTAERILLKVGTVHAETFDELFEGVRALPWENYIPENGKFWVTKATSVKSKLFSTSDIQSIVKKAMVRRMEQAYGKSWFEEDGAAKAPISETLAAALIMLTPWKRDRILVDPFCGSGTFPIEAAMMAANIAPGMNRSFLSENWGNLIEKRYWYDAVEEAQEGINLEIETDIQGYDLDAAVVASARENAKRAGVENLIHFQQRPVSELHHPKKYGFIITNPPYGERLEEKAELPALYRQIGESFDRLDTWSKYLITSYEDAQHYIGKKADKNRKIYNGMIRTYFYQYLGPRPPKREK